VDDEAVGLAVLREEISVRHRGVGGGGHPSRISSVLLAYRPAPPALAHERLVPREGWFGVGGRTE
jgi:hypothetical protein